MALRFENNGEKQRTPARKKRSRNISFYVAVVLCIGAVALTAAVRSADTKEIPERDDFPSVYEAADDEVQTAEGVLVGEWSVSDLTLSSSDMHHSAEQMTVTTVATAATEPELPAVTEAAAETTATEAVAVSGTLRYRMPTDGSVTGGYSGDELVFCATMCDWRVHNGIDISGEAGGEVRACADGIVENVVEDMLYGRTVIIRHADDSVLYYCGINSTDMVSAGQQVRAGDVIGYIGEVPCELADGPHIHLALMKDGSFIDPASLLQSS